MAYRYAVLGAGRQGVAAAYDLAKFGDAKEVILVDVDKNTAKQAAARVNELLKARVATFAQADVGETRGLLPILHKIDSLISAVPYYFNLHLTRVAIKAGVNMCDLGGNTNIVRKQLELDRQAKRAGVSIVPDCGMGPGMNISLALYAMSLLDKPEEVYIWDGGLPQNPKPPWGYLLTFNIEGLINEYLGDAYFLRKGKIVKVAALSGLEEINFPPLGRLEAAVTSGGISTMPWTFKGKLKVLENKTLRYPGHWAKLIAFAELGLFNSVPRKIGGAKIVPQDILKALLEPKITAGRIKDVCVIRVKCVGKKNGKMASVTVELIDYSDPKTGFTAMERITGWHASIVSILTAKRQIPRGAISAERAVPGEVVVNEAQKRGLKIAKRTVAGG